MSQVEKGKEMEEQEPEDMTKSLKGTKTFHSFKSSKTFCRIQMQKLLKRQHYCHLSFEEKIGLNCVQEDYSIFSMCHL